VNLLQERVAAFEASTPPYVVAGRLLPDYSSALEDALAGASPPDVFLAWSHTLPDLVADEHVLPLPVGAGAADAVPPLLRPAFEFEEVSYCVPHDIATLALFYNPALFDRAEAAYPHADWTWTDLRAAADAVTDRDFDLYGLVLTPDASRLLPFLWQRDVDGKPWQGSDAQMATEFYVNLFLDGVAVDPVTLNATWNGEAFGRGRAAMTIESGWLVPYLAEHFPDLDYSIVELPAGAVRSGSVAFGTCWAVGATAANPDAAIALAQHLGHSAPGSAWDSSSGALPPALSQAQGLLSSAPVYAPFVAAMASSLPWTGPPGFAAQVEIVNATLAGAIAGDATVDEVAAQLSKLQ
jgi:multiple sugar transport system substrate-binding protein